MNTLTLFTINHCYSLLSFSVFLQITRYLAENQLTGTIPSWICNYEFYYSFSLANNSFSGIFPKCLCQRQFDCSKFSGPNTHYTCPLPCCINVLACTNSSLGCQFDQFRKDCGFSGIIQQQCESKACCWSSSINLPFCFFKTNSSSPIN